MAGPGVDPGCGKSAKVRNGSEVWKSPINVVATRHLSARCRLQKANKREGGPKLESYRKRWEQLKGTRDATESHRAGAGHE